MANFSDYLEEALINHVLKNSAFSSPETVYAGIVSSDGSDTEMEAGTLTNEITAYTGNRKAISFGDITQVDGKATITNSSVIDFEDMPSVTVKYVIICDSTTSGNILIWAPLNTSAVVESGNTFRIPVDGLTIDLD